MAAVRAPASPIAAESPPPLTLRLRPAIELTEEQFFQFCQLNRDLRIERTATGEVVVMAPAGSSTGARNFDICGQLYVWCQRDGSGIAFDSSTGYTLPNGAVRSPDASWVLRERWERLSPAQQAGFAPLCPDFVVELRSPSDRLRDVQAKMREYVENGARLGWLIDPTEGRAYVYRPGAAVQRRSRPTRLSGDPVLPGFVLDLAAIW
jgi:Uma2 family endonuclease